MSRKNPQVPVRGRPPRRARMADIAEQAGVSVPAVSYVLNGQVGRVSEETAAKIRRIAEQLNFHPSHAARQLSGMRSHVVAALADTWFYQPPLRVFSWLNHLGAQRGLKILASAAEGAPFSMKEYAGQCLAWNVDGLMFVALHNDALWPDARKHLGRVPRVISLLGNPGISGGYCVEIDSVEGARLAVHHLHQQGRRKIVQILEDLDTQMNQRRWQGFREAHAELDRPLTDDQICLATAGLTQDHFPKFLELCEELVRVRGADALMADNDYGAAFLIKALWRLGLRVPDDVAVVGWGRETIAYWTNPSLTSVNFMLKDIVGKALELLAGLIEDPDAERPSVIVVKPELTIAESA